MKGGSVITLRRFTSLLIDFVPLLTFVKRKAPSDSSSLVHAIQESGIVERGSELQEVISKKNDVQFVKLLGIVAGCVAAREEETAHAPFSASEAYGSGKIGGHVSAQFCKSCEY